MLSTRNHSKEYENDTAFIPAHFQPAVLLDVCLSEQVPERSLLRGTRLHLEDIETAQKTISPAQFITLVGNCYKFSKNDDISFLFGQRILPGHFGACSQTLSQATNLRQAIQHLCDYHAILSPFVTPRFFENATHGFVYWQDSCGINKQQIFMIEAAVTALASMSNWLAGEALPWRYNFTHAQPNYIEQYWVHLGHEPLFKQQFNIMSIPKSYLDKAWPNAAPLAVKAAQIASDGQLQSIGYSKGFLDTVYDYFMDNIHQPISLNNLANRFNTSPASVKRKLLKHNTHYQAQLDLARKNTAFFLYQKGFNSQEVADHLRFNDMNNFRRSCKRWTGLSPNALIAEASAINRA